MRILFPQPKNCKDPMNYGGRARQIIKISCKVAEESVFLRRFHCLLNVSRLYQFYIVVFLARWGIHRTLGGLLC